MGKSWWLIMAGLVFWGAYLAFDYHRSSAQCPSAEVSAYRVAQQALDENDVNLSLVWVSKGQEAEVKQAFDQATAVRKLSPEAKALADAYFADLVARMHCDSQGEPYAGYKAGVLELGPAVPSAERALESGSLDILMVMLTDMLRQGVQRRFKSALDKRRYAPNDVAAGRAYIQSYVNFINYVTGVSEALRANPAEN